jgi:hypothetical protein
MEPQITQNTQIAAVKPSFRSSCNNVFLWTFSRHPDSQRVEQRQGAANDSFSSPSSICVFCGSIFLDCYQHNPCNSLTQQTEPAGRALPNRNT